MLLSATAEPFVGTDRGPLLLREQGLLKDLSALGWRVEDIPDLDFDTICADAVRDTTLWSNPSAKQR